MSLWLFFLNRLPAGWLVPIYSMTVMDYCIMGFWGLGLLELELKLGLELGIGNWGVGRPEKENMGEGRGLLHISGV